jgi:modulator of FtsH protease HflC
MSRIGFIAASVILALIVASSTLFIVDQRQIGVVYTLGEIKEVINEPGLIVDWLVKWRIVDSRQFIRNNNGADMRAAETKLSPIVQAAFNEEVTRRTVSGLLTSERDKVMQDVRARLLDNAKSFGIEIVDVRIKRVDFVPAISDAVYRRMQSERQQVANELRSTGNADKEKIQADADRQRAVIVAAAYRDAQKIKGEGDAKASALYADAFGRDPQFAQFYRSLEAYRASFRNKNDVMVLDPSSDFFRAMRGGATDTPAPPAAPRR